MGQTETHEVERLFHVSEEDRTTVTIGVHPTDGEAAESLIYEVEQEDGSYQAALFFPVDAAETQVRQVAEETGYSERGRDGSSSDLIFQSGNILLSYSPGKGDNRPHLEIEPGERKDLVDNRDDIQKYLEELHPEEAVARSASEIMDRLFEIEANALEQSYQNTV